ncbi:MAG: SUMF1/EgtB/PvdO family nonheme iron enzyme [Cyanobacteria bacterium]|nr:SUMF1/EgtB/PvdO family nonheme iron enzyme [Cyanobacteriota bacterium]
MPSYNEWYKAAFYDPNKSGGAGYWNYATGSDSAPTSVTGGTNANTAVYNQTAPADVTNAGGLSAYGVMSLNGNAREWEESSCDLTAGNYNTNGNSTRGYRGGNYATAIVLNLSSSIRQCDNPSLLSNNIGF